ncbi:unnamed protein product, partial [Symbiodinium sp. KB8]
MLGLLAVSVLGRNCPQELHGVFADMHDGDKKQVTIAGTSLTIKPSGNSQSWVVKAELDTESCQATVDFNVPGKPNPPPVNLLMTLWLATSDEASAGQAKTTFEFTDPSGKLASPHMPLNSWLFLGTPQVVKAISCPESLKAVYADMHDGDKKAVEIQEGKVTIRPSGNNQTWVVNADLDDRCTAEVDFNVPGFFKSHISIEMRLTAGAECRKLPRRNASIVSATARHLQSMVLEMFFSSMVNCLCEVWKVFQNDFVKPDELDKDAEYAFPFALLAQWPLPAGIKNHGCDLACPPHLQCGCDMNQVAEEATLGHFMIRLPESITVSHVWDACGLMFIDDALPGGRRIFERPRWSGAGGLCVQTICALAPGRQPDFDAGHCRKLNDLTDERRSHEALHAAFAGIANNCNKGGSPESTWIKMMTMKTVACFCDASARQTVSTAGAFGAEALAPSIQQLSENILRVFGSQRDACTTGDSLERLGGNTVHAECPSFLGRTGAQVLLSETSPGRGTWPRALDGSLQQSWTVRK